MTRRSIIKGLGRTVTHLSKGRVALSIFMLAIMLASTVTQTAQAFDEEFFSGNDILFYDNRCANVSSGDGSLIGNENAEKIWNFLVGNDGNIPAQDRLSPEQAAGVMGNLRQESGPNFDPDLEEATDRAQKGYGIAQWTFGRRTALEDAARRQGVAVSDLAFQLNFLYEEAKSRPALGGGGDEWTVLKTKTTIEDALVFWHDSFERSADSRQAVIQTRGGFAQDAYDSFKDMAPSGDTSGSSAGKAATIFLDPGHGGAIPEYTDEQSGLVTAETPNSPEREDMLEVANRIKSDLEQAGYIVALSRTSNTAKVTFRERADAAAAAQADLAISLHSTPGEINEVWPQRVGTYREYGNNKDTFNNTETAQKSESIADIVARTRSAAEGHTATTDPNNTQQAASFSREGIKSKGNISLIQLWSPTVPFIYNEIGQDDGTALSEERKSAYAKGIVDGVKEAIPVSNSEACSGSFSGGDLAATTLAYAWPEYRGNDTTKKPEYAAAVREAQSDGMYVGGCEGVDCGAFTSLLIINSGFDPGYNHEDKLSRGAGPTDTQEAWARSNWDSIGSGNSIDTSELRPGDVAFSPGHTFIYVGDIPGFDSNRASASLCGRAPMAGRESLVGGDVSWYRKRG